MLWKKAIPRRTHSRPRRGYRIGLNSTTLPAIGVAFLPKSACPACWPAYAGLLSTFGISFVDYGPYLLPLTSLFLVIALAALAIKSVPAVVVNGELADCCAGRGVKEDALRTAGIGQPCSWFADE